MQLWEDFVKVSFLCFFPFQICVFARYSVFCAAFAILPFLFPVISIFQFEVCLAPPMTSSRISKVVNSIYFVIPSFFSHFFSRDLVDTLIFKIRASQPNERIILSNPLSVGLMDAQQMRNQTARIRANIPLYPYSHRGLPSF